MTSERIERRRFPRRSVIGVAHVTTEARYAGVFFLENLSAGGALLVGEPRLPLGTPVRILLEIHGGRRVGVDGQVTRHAVRDGQHLWAAAFRNVPAAIEEELQKIALDAVQHARPTVLVVDAARATREALTHDLVELGRDSVGVGTVLDTLAWLHARDVTIEALMVGSQFVRSAGVGLLELVATDFPATRRVLVVDSDDHETAQAAGSAHGRLDKPWTLAGLAHALGLR
jgi:hypothetical protein